MLESMKNSLIFTEKAWNSMEVEWVVREVFVLNE